MPADAAQTAQGHRGATDVALSDDIDCAESTESVEVTVLGAGDFSAGDAGVRVSLFSCDAPGVTCKNTTAVGVVRFVEAPSD